MKYEIIDNLIDQQQFDFIQNQMLGGNKFPWYYSPTKINEDDKDSANYSFQFIHMFYNHMQPESEYIDLIAPIIDAINPLSIIKIKANLTTLAPEIIELGWHTDYPVDGSGPKAFLEYGRTAVFYVNDSNGPTILELDGEQIEVEAKGNRLVSFDPTLLHTGTSSTNTKARALININYIPR